MAAQPATGASDCSPLVCTDGINSFFNTTRPVTANAAREMISRTYTSSGSKCAGTIHLSVNEQEAFARTHMRLSVWSHTRTELNYIFMHIEIRHRCMLGSTTTHSGMSFTMTSADDSQLTKQKSSSSSTERCQSCRQHLPAAAVTAQQRQDKRRSSKTKTNYMPGLISTIWGWPSDRKLGLRVSVR